jgi:hypothetical protein
MLALIVIQLEVDKNGTTAGDQIVEALKHIDPQTVPHFKGDVNVVPEPYASEAMIRWLEE